MEIVPYACPGCGYYHLTKKADGSDVLQRDKGAVVVTRSTPTHPVFAPIPERVELPREPEEEPPVIPANREARARVLRKWLAANPGIEPTTIEVSAILGVKHGSIAQYMEPMGYRNTKGRSARWVYDPPAAPEPEVQHQEPPKPIRPEWQDIALGSMHHIVIGDLISVMAAAGKTVRIQISDAAS